MPNLYGGVLKVGVACSGRWTPCMRSGGRRWRSANGGDWKCGLRSSSTWPSLPRSTSRRAPAESEGPDPEHDLPLPVMSLPYSHDHPSGVHSCKEQEL